MAKYNVRGLSPLNRAKDMVDALSRAQTDDTVIWNGKEKNTGLMVSQGIKIIGNNALLKIPEHEVGLIIKGQGNLSLSKITFLSKEICNAISIDAWAGTLVLENITSEYNTRKRENAYPTIMGDSLQHASMSILGSVITRLTIRDVQSIEIVNTTLSEQNVITGAQVALSNSDLLGNTQISSDDYHLDSIKADNLILKGSGVATSVQVNNGVKFTGNTEIDNLTVVDGGRVILEDGMFIIRNTDLSRVDLVANNAEIVAKEGAMLPKEMTGSATVANQSSSEQGSESEAYQELQDMIGLDSVKKTVDGYINMARVGIAREKAGLGKFDLSLSMIFTGSPGTGKTSVAKLLGKIMFEQGILPTSKFVHVGRKDLVGTHIGETAQLTANKVQEALGGILFIDEAYSLLPDEGNSKDYGTEAIDTLTDEMEKYHNDLVVIMAGYTDSMYTFFKRANPGLRSRFATDIEFPDYSLDELYQIAMLKLNKQFTFDQKVGLYVKSAIKNFKARNLTNGNGRFIRIFIQEIVATQANRLTSTHANLNLVDPTTLSTLIPEDINTAYKSLMTRLLRQ